MTIRSDGFETRERLLEAALDVFVEKGFRDATVAEICRRAEANIAAVNYHFGGKEHLYVEVWRRAFEEAGRQLPIDGGLPPSAPPRRRLRALISAILSRILRHGRQSRSGRLLLQAMAQPQDVLREARREATQPIRDGLRTIVRDLLGPDANEDDVSYCAMSVLHQVLAMGFRGGRKPPLLGGGTFSEQEVDRLIEHTYRFSLGGIRAVARRSRCSDAVFRQGGAS